MLLQLREERRQAQAKVAADAKTQLIKETEWMRRQPKARSTKAKFREDAYYVLKAAARSGPARDTTINFGGAEGTRQVRHFSTSYGKKATNFPAQLPVTLCRPFRCTLPSD